MGAFDPDRIAIPAGRFIGGRLVNDALHGMAAARPSDGPPRSIHRHRRVATPGRIIFLLQPWKR
jgi:hypothetical protein